MNTLTKRLFWMALCCLPFISSGCKQSETAVTVSYTHLKQRPFRILKIGLTRDREELYDRINRRVDQMMEEGLLEEVRLSLIHI